MRRKCLIVILTVALFLGAAVLGVSATFRVDAVTLNSSEVSDEAKAEAKELLTRLEEVYLDENILFAEKSDANGVMSEFPYFRITSFKRSYPNRLIISIAEGGEVFAVENANENGEYYILNGEGTILGVRSDPNNRLDGKRNVLLKGYLGTGDKGEKLAGDVAVAPTVAISSAISKKLDGIRGNVRSVEVIARTNTEDGVVLLFEMQEGVRLCVYAAEISTGKKAEKAIDAYLALSVSDRMSGYLMVYENTLGEVVSAYRAEGGLPV